MKVTIDAHTPNPVGLIAKEAGTCTGNRNESEKRVKKCFWNNEMSVFEHASVTFNIEGVSRVLTHQLVRHRHISPSQRSGRYVKEKEPEVVCPPRIQADEKALDIFAESVYQSITAYKKLLEAGIPAEDARYVLPEGLKTNIAFTANWRTIYELLTKRTDPHAQWEIREAMWKIVSELREYEDMKPLIDLWDNAND